MILSLNCMRGLSLMFPQWESSSTIQCTWLSVDFHQQKRHLECVLPTPQDSAFLQWSQSERSAYLEIKMADFQFQKWLRCIRAGRQETDKQDTLHLLRFTKLAPWSWRLNQRWETVSHPYGRRNLGLHNISDVDDHLTTSDTTSDYRWCQIHFQCYNALSLFCVWSTTSNTINSNINSRAISSSCQDRNAYMKRSFDNSECS